MKFTEGLLCSAFVPSAKLRHKRKEESITINGKVTGGAENRLSFISNKILIFSVSRVEDMVEDAVWESHKGF